MAARIRRMLKIESNMIQSVGFDPATPGAAHGYLAVQFANFDVYGYEDVPHSSYLQILNGVSVGQVFNELVKDRFKGIKLSSEQTTVSGTASKPVVEKKPEVEAAPLFDMMDNNQTKESKQRGRLKK